MAKRQRVVVVTGASAGIGRAAAHAFASSGARLALLARNRDALLEAQRELEKAGAQVMVLPADVAEFEQIERAAEQVESAWGPIDVWVNNAMVTVFGPVSELAPDELRRVTEVTYLGAAYGTMVALARMRPRNHGCIVQVGSALAYRAIPLQSAYCAAKHALRGFTDAVRCELLHEGSGVHVTSVHLAAFNTPQFEWARNHMSRRPQPLPPIFQPEIAGRAIEWASRQRRREVFVGFPAFLAVLANKLAPGLLDRKMADQAWDGQLSQQQPPTASCENLFHGCDGGYGVHGRFDSQARRHSGQFLFTRFRRAAIASIVLATIAVLALVAQ